MKESRGCGDLAGIRARARARRRDDVDAGAAVLARLGRARHQDVHGDGRPAGDRGRAGAVRDLGLRGRLLGRPHEEPRRRRAARRLSRARGADCSTSTTAPSPTARPGASLAELDVLVRDGIAALGYPGQPSHPICHGIGARAHEPPYAHQAGGGTVAEGMVLAIEPGCYWEGGGGLRVEDNFLITAGGAEKLSEFPGRSRVMQRADLDRVAERPVRDSRPRRPLRHDAARRRADRRRRARPAAEARDRTPARRPRRRPDRGRFPARLGRRLAGGRS